MANFYKGTEIKFSVELTAEGFSMDENDFDIEVATSRSSVKGSKAGSGPNYGSADVKIYKDTETWYAVAKTNELTRGDLRVIATAYIPDAGAFDGVRTEIAVAPLGTLEMP